jgi:Kef-type K+ transport system membrane component KefB
MHQIPSLPWAQAASSSMHTLLLTSLPSPTHHIWCRLLVQEWPLVLALLAGLLSLKITVISALGPLFGLTRAESVRTGFVLSQGGEFAFVLLALANQLEVLPAELNRLLIIVVVLSMALTPLLTEVGKQFGGKLGAGTGQGETASRCQLHACSWPRCCFESGLVVCSLPALPPLCSETPLLLLDLQALTPLPRGPGARPQSPG